MDYMDDISRLMTYGGIGGLASGLGSLFGGGGQDPFKGANKYWNQIPGATMPFFSPYMQAGQGALGQLQGQYGNLLGNLSGLQGQYGNLAGGLNGVQGQYNQLMNDPNAVYNKIASGYQKSPGYDWQLKQGTNAVNNAAAAGGMLGSPEHQQNAATLTQGLANQDFQNYLQQGLGLYNTGLQGNQNLGMFGMQGQQGLYNQGLNGLQDINHMGYGANDQMARIMADLLSQQGQGSFAGQASQNQSQGQGWGNLFGGLGSIFSGLFL
jgi:hypothetical protein